MSDAKRPQRVEKVIAQELAKMLVEGLKDPRIGFATVTEVRVSGDLRNAKVFVSVYGDAEERQRSVDALQAAAGFLRHELGHRLSLRYTPELVFFPDATLDHAARLDALLDAASHGAEEAPAELPPEVLPVHTSRSELAERARDFSQEPAPEERRPARRRRPRRR